MAKSPIKTIEHADQRVAKSLAAFRDTLPVRAAGQLSELADQPPLIVLSITTIAAGLFAHDRRLARAGTRMLAAHLLATAFKAVVKKSVDRTRPAVAERTGYKRGKGRVDAGPLNSFPSGHTAGAFAVARAIGRDYPQAAAPALALATTVALVLIPRGKHYPSDVVAGVAIGLVAEAFVDRVTRSATQRVRPLRPASTAARSRRTGSA